MTGVTGNAAPIRSKPVVSSNGYLSVAKKIEAMPLDEFRASLVRAGITTREGKLRSKYKKK